MDKKLSFLYKALVMMKRLLIIAFIFFSHFLAAQEEMFFAQDEGGNLTPLEQSEGFKEFPQPNYEQNILKMFFLLLALVAFFILTVWLMKRFIRGRMTASNSMSKIQVLEKKMLSPKSILYLVKVEQKKILISESHLEVRKIETLEKPLNPESE